MNKKNPIGNGVQLPFNDQQFIDKWQEWLQYRKERRLAAYAPTGLKKTFTKLVNDCGNDVKLAIQMIDHAMACSWQGIYPIKSLNNAAHFQPNTGSANKQGISGARINAVKNF